MSSARHRTLCLSIITASLLLASCRHSPSPANSATDALPAVGTLKVDINRNTSNVLVATEPGYLRWNNSFVNDTAPSGTDATTKTSPTGGKNSTA